MAKNNKTPAHEKAQVEVERSSDQKLVYIERKAPLPDPKELQDYQNIDKSFPERIFKMAEKEQHFRHISTLLGQIGFITLVIGGFAIASYTAIQGAQLTGAVIAGAVGYIVYVFKSKNPQPPKPQEETRQNRSSTNQTSRI